MTRMICCSGVVINRFCRLVGREPEVQKLYAIWETFSLANEYGTLRDIYCTTDLRSPMVSFQTQAVY